MEKAVQLLKPGGRIIPARGSVRVALGHYLDADKKRMGTVEGFDLSPFNDLAPKSLRIKRHDRGLSLVSDPADLFSFDFTSGGPFPESRSSVSLTANTGAANGVAQWIYLKLDDAAEYENHPVNAAASNWAVIFYPFAANLRYDKGDRVRLCGSHDRNRLRVWTEKQELTV
jgi:hypothetical protein